MLVDGPKTQPSGTGADIGAGLSLDACSSTGSLTLLVVGVASDSLMGGVTIFQTLVKVARLFMSL